eukprot:7500088-Pyramimonas_sp.AAC.1
MSRGLRHPEQARGVGLCIRLIDECKHATRVSVSANRALRTGSTTDNAPIVTALTSITAGQSLLYLAAGKLQPSCGAQGS